MKRKLRIPTKGRKILLLLASVALFAISAILLLLPTGLKTGEPFPLVNGQTVFFPEGRFNLTLRGVSDSRCPTGVQCVWEGEARVLVAVTGLDKPLTLATREGLSSQPIGETPYYLELLSVEPYPSAKNVAEVSGKTATFKIRKK